MHIRGAAPYPQAHLSMTADLHDIPALVRSVKQRLRGVMNGPLSASMRDKGLRYKVNFGVELPRLREMAGELPPSAELAGALWKEDIRECRILAGLLMPPAHMSQDLADLWVEQMRFVEEAELTVMHLFARTPWAGEAAFRWIASPDGMHELCGYLLLARLFMQGMRPSERDTSEYLDQTGAALRSDTLSVRNAAGKALLKYMGLDADCERAGEALLQSLEAASADPVEG